MTPSKSVVTTDDILAQGEDPCNDECKEQIDVSQISDLVKEMDILLRTSLEQDLNKKRINGSTFVDVWSKMMSQVISSSISGVTSLQAKETAFDRAVKAEQINASQIKSSNETCIASANCSLSAAKQKAEDIKNATVPGDGSLYEQNRLVLVSQEELYKRQKTGFDDNARQKMLDSQISAWSIAWKEGNGLDIPCAISNCAINHTLENINDDMGKESNNGVIPLVCQEDDEGNPVDPCPLEPEPVP